MAYLLYTVILIGRHLSVHLVKTSIRVHLNFMVSIFTICNGAYYDQSNSYICSLYMDWHPPQVTHQTYIQLVGLHMRNI